MMPRSMIASGVQPKGLYAKAMHGDILDLLGLGIPHHAPECHDIYIHIAD